MIPRPLGLAAAIAALMMACAPAYDVQTLFSQLQSNDTEERQDAQEKIDRIMRTGDYKVFLRGLESPVTMNRPQAIIYLSFMKQPEARAALRDLLRVDRRMMIPFNPIRMKPTSELSDSRILVANLIATDGGDPEAVNLLIEGVDGKPVDVVAATCYAVGALRDPKGIPFLRTVTGQGDPEVVRAAVQALGMFRTPEAIEALAAVAHHPSAEVRNELLSSLQMEETPAVIGILETLASSDPDPQIRTGAMGQLSRFKEPSPVPFLIEQLKGKDQTTRQAALDALRLLSGQPYGPRPELWARWWQDRQKLPLARP